MSIFRTLFLSRPSGETLKGTFLCMFRLKELFFVCLCSYIIMIVQFLRLGPV
jgi:hypothetical protein